MYVCMYVVCIFIEGTLQFLLLCFGSEAVAAAAAAGVGGVINNVSPTAQDTYTHTHTKMVGWYIYVV
jgi:hypothetical protein